MNLRTSMRLIRSAVKANMPNAALMSAGASFLAAIGFAVDGTVKAVRKTDYEAEKKGADLTSIELVKTNWKYFIFPALFTANGIMSLCVASKGYTKSIKQLAALYAAAETTKKELEDTTLSTFGEKKLNELKSAIAEKRMESDPVDSKPIIDTGRGGSLCYDMLSGRYFRCDRAQIERGLNNFNKRLLVCEALSYNELFFEISPELEEAQFGDDIGFNINDGLVSLHFCSKLAKNGEPCLVISYPDPPRYRYDRY